MIKELVPLAFKFRNTKLWEILSDHDIYAVQLRDGRIGYCCIMGNSGLHYSLGLFIGQIGWNSYIDLFEAGSNAGPIDDNMIGRFYEIDCINCDLMDREDIAPSKAKNLTLAYAAAHKIRTTGEYAVPDFVRMTPYHEPWVLTQQSDADAMEDALNATLFLAKFLKKNFFIESAGFTFDGVNPLDYEGVEIPFLVPEGNSWTIKSTTLPERLEKVYPAPKFDYPDLVKKIMAIKSKVNLECGFYVLETPITDAEIPYMPVSTFFVEMNTQFVLFTKIDRMTDTMPDSQIQAFADRMIGLGWRPQTIYVPDLRTHELFKDFCLKTKTKLIQKKHLTLLPQIMKDFHKMAQKGPGIKF